MTIFITIFAFSRVFNFLLDVTKIIKGFSWHTWQIVIRNKAQYISCELKRVDILHTAQGGQAPGETNICWKLIVEHFVYFAMSTMQGHIFQEIQPTTICQIELILDKKQAKKQWRPFFNSQCLKILIQNPCLAFYMNFMFLSCFSFWIHLPNWGNNSRYVLRRRW